MKKNDFEPSLKAQGIIGQDENLRQLVTARHVDAIVIRAKAGSFFDLFTDSEFVHQIELAIRKRFFEQICQKFSANVETNNAVPQFHALPIRDNMSETKNYDFNSKRSS